MAAQKNLAVEVNKIRDEKYKNELIKKIRTYTSDIKSAVTGAFTSKHKNSVQGVMVKSADRIVDAIGLLTNELKRILTNPIATPVDSQLTEALKPETSGAVAAESNTTAQAADPALLDSLTAIQTTIEKGDKEIVSTEKAQIANQTAIEKAKKQDILLGNGVKNTVDKDKKKTKAERPKFPIDFKQFMGGLGKILSGILNPVALIVGFISHLLPYIILAVAFFKGFWSKLEQPLKDKIKEVAWKIAKIAVVAFAVFKGPALLIRTLTIAYHAARMVYLAAKWVKDMIIWAFDLQAKTTEHSLKIGSIILEKGMAVIEHGIELALKAFKFILAVLEFSLVAMAVIAIIGMIVLLVAGILVLFGVFGDEIIAMIEKIVDVFKEIGNIVLDVIGTLVDTVVDFVGTLIEKLFTGLFSGSGNNATAQNQGIEAESDNNKKPEKVDIIDGVTLNAFDQAINRIIIPLNMLSFSVASIAEMEMLKTLNPMGMSMGALATAVGTIYNVMENNPTIKNADNTNMNINYDQIQADENAITPADVKKFMTAINQLVDNSDKIFKKIPTESGGTRLFSIG